MDTKNLFFGLGSILIIIIILSMLGVLEPKHTEEATEVVVQRSGDPVYYGGPYRKNIVYAPDVYTRPIFRRGYGRSGFYY